MSRKSWNWGDGHMLGGVQALVNPAVKARAMADLAMKNKQKPAPGLYNWGKSGMNIKKSDQVIVDRLLQWTGLGTYTPDLLGAVEEKEGGGSELDEQERARLDDPLITAAKEPETGPVVEEEEAEEEEGMVFTGEQQEVEKEPEPPAEETVSQEFSFETETELPETLGPFSEDPVAEEEKTSKKRKAVQDPRREERRSPSPGPREAVPTGEAAAAAAAAAEARVQSVKFAAKQREEALQKQTAEAKAELKATEDRSKRELEALAQTFLKERSAGQAELKQLRQRAEQTVQQQKLDNAKAEQLLRESARRQRETEEHAARQSEANLRFARDEQRRKDEQFQIVNTKLEERVNELQESLQRAETGSKIARQQTAELEDLQAVRADLDESQQKEILKTQAETARRDAKQQLLLMKNNNLKTKLETMREKMRLMGRLSKVQEDRTTLQKQIIDLESEQQANKDQLLELFEEAKSKYDDQLVRWIGVVKHSANAASLETESNKLLDKKFAQQREEADAYLAELADMPALVPSVPEQGSEEERRVRRRKRNEEENEETEEELQRIADAENAEKDREASRLFKEQQTEEAAAAVAAAQTARIRAETERDTAELEKQKVATERETLRKLQEKTTAEETAKRQGKEQERKELVVRPKEPIPTKARKEARVKTQKERRQLARTSALEAGRVMPKATAAATEPPKEGESAEAKEAQITASAEKQAASTMQEAMSAQDFPKQPAAAAAAPSKQTGPTPGAEEPTRQIATSRGPLTSEQEEYLKAWAFLSRAMKGFAKGMSSQAKDAATKVLLGQTPAPAAETKKKKTELAPASGTGKRKLEEPAAGSELTEGELAYLRGEAREEFGRQMEESPGEEEKKQPSKTVTTTKEDQERLMDFFEQQMKSPQASRATKKQKTEPAPKLSKKEPIDQQLTAWAKRGAKSYDEVRHMINQLKKLTGHGAKGKARTPHQKARGKTANAAMKRLIESQQLVAMGRTVAT